MKKLLLFLILLFIPSILLGADVTIMSNLDGTFKGENVRSFWMNNGKLVVFTPKGSGGSYKFMSSADLGGTWIQGDSNLLPGIAGTHYSYGFGSFYIYDDTIIAVVNGSTTDNKGIKAIIRNDSVKVVSFDTIGATVTANSSPNGQHIFPLTTTKWFSYNDTVSGVQPFAIATADRWSNTSTWTRTAGSTNYGGGNYRIWNVNGYALMMDSTKDLKISDGTTDFSVATGGTDIIAGADGVGSIVKNMDVVVRTPSLTDSVFYIVYEKQDSIKFLALKLVGTTVSTIFARTLDTPNVHSKRGSGGPVLSMRYPQVTTLGNRVYVGYKWWSDSLDADSIDYVYQYFTGYDSTPSARTVFRPATGIDTLVGVEFPQWVDTTGTVVLPIIFSDSVTTDGTAVVKFFSDTISYSTAPVTVSKQIRQSVTRKGKL